MTRNDALLALQEILNDIDEAHEPTPISRSRLTEGYKALVVLATTEALHNEILYPS